MSGDRNYAWLPDHQLPIASTLAHSNTLIAFVGDLLFDYLKDPGPFELASVDDDTLEHVVARSIAPLPEAISRFSADAMTQLRAALEHALYAQVEQQLGRPLTAKEGRWIEMPARATADSFGGWVTAKPRQQLLALLPDGSLLARVERLQPYHRADPHNHPLMVLAEHTNFAKHRAPAVAATLLSTVRADDPRQQERIVMGSTDGPVAAGQILATATGDVQIPLSIWPNVSVRRPQTGTWHILMHELGELEEWVRTIAVPIIVSGDHDGPALPAGLNTSVGYSDLRAALTTANTMTAHHRGQERMQAVIAREGITDMLAAPMFDLAAHQVDAWLTTRTDSQVLASMDSVAKAQDQGGLLAIAGAVKAFADEVRRHGDAGGTAAE